MACKIGQQVLVSLLYSQSKYPEVITQVNYPSFCSEQPHCSVRLDDQKHLVDGVVYLEVGEIEVKCSHWQCCRDDDDNE